MFGGSMYDKRITDEKCEDDLKTIIKAGTKIKGDISGSNEVYIEGELQGNVKLDTLLFLGKNAKLKGKVEANNVVIEGKLEGDIFAKNMIELRATANFNGQVICKRIAIEEGAYFHGEVKMDDGQNLTPMYFNEKRKDLKKK